MKINLNNETKDRIKAYTISGIIIVFVGFLFKNFSYISNFFNGFIDSLSPFILGFAIAFILIPLRKFIENRCLVTTKLKPRTKRTIAVTLTMIVFALVIASFFIVLIPQLISSIKTLIDSFDGYMKTFSELTQNIYIQPEYEEIFNMVWESLKNIITSFISNEADLIAQVVTYSVSFVSSIFNVFVALIITIYLLLDQERFMNQLKKVIRAIFSKKHADSLFYVGRLTSKMFNNFIFGKALDSLIIGLICWVGTTLLKMPYAALISFVVGLTNMIPVFGPFIGAIPCIFILLFISPIKAVEFAIFILALQQVDGNIIGPYILGDSMGLPALWIMFAIIIGGGLFGVIGMFLGVPLFSVIYVLIRDSVNKKLEMIEKE